MMVLFGLALLGRVVSFYHAGGDNLLREASSDFYFGAYAALILAGFGVKQWGDKGSFREANPYIAWGLGIIAALVVFLVAMNPKMRCSLSGGEWITVTQRCFY
jgi:hypothetical protein